MSKIVNSSPFARFFQVFFEKQKKIEQLEKRVSDLEENLDFFSKILRFQQDSDLNQVKNLN